MTKSGKIRAAIAIVLVVLMAIANVGLNMGKLVLDKVFGTVSYSRDEEDVDKAIEESREVALKVEEEGIVLLQNDGDYLPVAGLDRVNLFGWGSYSPISCMVGSAAVNNDEEQKISITAAFERAGIEYNKDIEKMYDGLGFSGSSSTRAGNADYHLYEAGKDEIDGVMEGAKEFSDVAVITLGRAAGESTDVPLYMDEAKASAWRAGITWNCRSGRNIWFPRYAKILKMSSCCLTMPMSWSLAIWSSSSKSVPFCPSGFPGIMALPPWRRC